MLAGIIKRGEIMAKNYITKSTSIQFNRKILT
jgi:hypothetical protein